MSSTLDPATPWVVNVAMAASIRAWRRRVRRVSARWATIGASVTDCQSASYTRMHPREGGPCSRRLVGSRHVRGALRLGNGCPAHHLPASVALDPDVGDQEDAEAD